MRLLTFKNGDSSHVGVEKDGGIVDLTTRLGLKSVKGIIEKNQFAEAQSCAEKSPVDFKFDDVKLELPIPNPAKIYCVGVNYANRNAEYKDGSDMPKYPSLFVRNPLSFSAHNQPVLIPPESEQLDYEGEIVVVIGKRGRRISQADAHNYIAGLTIMNEGTIRDWVRHGKFNVTPGKNWDNTGGIGPWIETDISNLDLENLRVETHVNGESRQDDTTASMMFPIRRIIEYVSTFGTLLPGDLIATGTPTGAAARFDPPKWLREGDIVKVSVEGVGELMNKVEKELQ